MKVYILLPSYNEAENLPSLIAGLNTQLKADYLFYEIVIVDDGSIDNTFELIQKYKNSKVKLVKHTRNLGLGRTMDTGFRTILQTADNSDLIIVMDADNTHDVETIPLILKAYHAGYDLILTSRFVPGGGDRGISFFRRIMSHGAGLVFQVIFPIGGVREYTSSFRGYRVSLLKKGYITYKDRFIRENGFNCMLEILIKLSTFSPKIIEVPTILYYYRKKGKSKMNITQTLWRYFIIALNRNRFNQ